MRGREKQKVNTHQLQFPHIFSLMFRNNSASGGQKTMISQHRKVTVSLRQFLGNKNMINTTRHSVYTFGAQSNKDRKPPTADTAGHWLKSTDWLHEKPGRNFECSYFLTGDKTATDFNFPSNLPRWQTNDVGITWNRYWMRATACVTTTR
jgi:hypothetical protein